jgi:methylmalonyl-CoA mutase
VYGDIGAEVASALKAAGARFVWLAGRPRSGIDELSAAGIDDYVVLGGDAVATLQHAHTVLEVKP